MDIRIGSKNGAQVASLPAVAEQIQSKIQSCQEQWLEELSAEPGRLIDVEQGVHQQFSQLADQMVATLLAEASRRSAMRQAQKKSWLGRLANFVRQKNAL